MRIDGSTTNQNVSFLLCKKTHPKNVLPVYRDIGSDKSSPTNRSLIVPPATERKADPESPLRKRETKMVAILSATAHGIIHMTKAAYE